MSTQTLKRYYLKKPTGKRKSFAIYLQTVNSDSSTSNETIQNKDLEAINSKLHDGLYSITEAHVHAEKLRQRLNKDLGVIPPHKDPFNQIVHVQNQRLLEKYWDSEIAYRDLVDEESALGKLRRAVNAIGDCSLATATRGELTKKVKDLPFENTKKRQITSSLNQLLKYAGRDFKLIQPKKQRARVKFLTVDEFNKVMDQMTCEGSKALCRAAFLSGGRQGECFAMDTRKVKGHSVYIETQLTEDNDEKDPKWGSVRPAYAFDGLLDVVKQINELRHEGKLPTRPMLRKNFTRACMRAFPGDRSKHCCYHDLRHSYAIRLLSMGVNLTLVAQSLGNSVVVCQEYYAGFVLVNESLEMISAIVKGAT